MRTIAVTAALLGLSNVFMTFAWYAHLKVLYQKPSLIAVLVSWGIALFEYLLQVPANRIGFTVFNVAQLKILQEIITLSVFVPFAFFYMKEPLKLDYEASWMTRLSGGRLPNRIKPSRQISMILAQAGLIPAYLDR